MSVKLAYMEIDKTMYLKKILQLLHMDMEDFMHCLVCKCNYEVRVYDWVQKFYLQDMSSKEAVQEINKKLINITINTECNRDAQ